MICIILLKIYFTLKAKLKLIKKIFLSLLVFSAPAMLVYVLLVRFGIITGFETNQPLEAIADMDYQPKVGLQSLTSFFPDSLSLRLPPPGSIPTIGISYKFEQTDYEAAEKAFSNPITDNHLELKRGKNRFEAFCSPCHGFQGHGDGTVITKVEMVSEDDEPFPGPPDFCRPETRAMSDARLFHIISSGQNLMFPQKSKLNELDRWRIIRYIRSLQDTIKNN